MRIVKDEDGDTFIVFEDFEELKRAFMEAVCGLENESTDKNLSRD
jgi:peptide subunit release factor 1 (eRF1)